MENKEILMLRVSLRAEWSLPSGNALHTGRTASRAALSSLWSEQKAAVTMVSSGWFRQKNVVFSQSPGVAFPLSPHSWDATEPTQGPHSTFSPWVLILQLKLCRQAGASLLHCTRAFVSTGRVRARWLYCLAKYIPTFLAMDKDIAELLALNENIYLLFLATRSFINVLF